MNDSERTTLFLARLSMEDFRRFNKLPFAATGTTGPNADPKKHGEMAPYIATFLSELGQAIETLCWDNVSVKRKDGQWVAENAAAQDDSSGIFLVLFAMIIGACIAMLVWLVFWKLRS